MSCGDGVAGDLGRGCPAVRGKSRMRQASPTSTLAAVTRANGRHEPTMNPSKARAPHLATSPVVDRMLTRAAGPLLTCGGLNCPHGVRTSPAEMVCKVWHESGGPDLRPGRHERTMNALAASGSGGQHSPSLGVVLTSAPAPSSQVRTAGRHRRSTGNLRGCTGGEPYGRLPTAVPTGRSDRPTAQPSESTLCQRPQP